jgi:hypothetical protein
MTLTAKGSWLYVLLAALAIFALFFSACGGDDDDDDSNEPTASADAGDDDNGDNEDETPVVDGDDDGGDDDSGADDDDGGDGDDGGSDDPFEDLDELAGEFEASTGRVTYESTDEDGVTSTITIYSDGEGHRTRYDSIDDSGTFSLITTPDATFTCSESEGTGSCLQSEGSDLGGLGLFGIFSNPQALVAYINAFDTSGVDVDTSTEEIAGTDANCFEWSGEVDGDEGSGKVCFSDSGLLLLGEFDSTTDGTSSSMRATDFSDEVSDSDFEPPYEVIQLPGG